MEAKTREKERWEIEELVFDRISLLSLGRMIKKGFFEKIDYVVSTGKEANVYRAKASRGHVAVKIYKVETSNFMKRKDYIFSDPRFRFRKIDERKLVYAFASKEFKNLRIAKKIGIKCPSPMFHENNIVIMSFLGKQGLPFPKLIDSYKFIENVEELMHDIIKDIKKMNKNGFVHGDLSEYNILFDPTRQIYYFIDFGQGTVRGNPNYENFLKRDIKNILSFFRKKLNLKLNENEILKEVVEED